MDIQTLTNIVIVGHAIYAGILVYYYTSTKKAKRYYTDNLNQCKMRAASDQVIIKGLEYCLTLANQRIKTLDSMYKTLDSKYQLLAYFEETTSEQTTQEEVKTEE